MITAWIVISSILSGIWVIVFVIGCGYALFGDDFRDRADRREFFQFFSAVMAGAAIFALVHWIVLLLAIPAFLLYGLWSGVRLLIKRPWRETQDA